MKQKTKVIIIAISIVVLCIVITVCIVLPKNVSNKKELEVEKEKTNTNPKLTEKHCLNSLCTSNMKMTYQKKVGKLAFTLKNESAELVPAGFLKITSKEDNLISYVVYYDELQPNEKVDLSVICDSNNIIKIKDYELTALSEKELAEAKSLISNEVEK